MRRIFKFSNKDSFYSEDSEEFAKLVLSASASVRRRLFDSYGIKLQLGNDPIQIAHDGRRVGLGSFRSEGNEVHFSILPKAESVHINRLAKALKGISNLADLVRFESSSPLVPVGKDTPEFKLAYQKALFENVINQLRRLSSVFNVKTIIPVRGGVKGRPLIRESLELILKGTGFEIKCEVLIDKDLSDYVLVLMATAESIRKELQEIASFIPDFSAEFTKVFEFMLSRFPNVHLARFNRSVLFKTCRPPYPYGLKNILSQCLYYWISHGEFAGNMLGARFFEYWGMAVDMDMLFEHYVRQVWISTSRPFFDLFPIRSGDYSIVSENGCQSEDRSILPDVILKDRENSQVLVVDAKYRTDIGTRDQVAQILSYLDYIGFNETKDINNRIGILAYPGDSFEVARVTNFEKRVYVVRMPISEDLCNAELFEFIKKLREK